MDNMPSADILGASGEESPRPHFDTAFRRATALDHHASALRGAAKLFDALASQAVQQREDGYRTADVVNALERETHHLHAEIAALRDMIAERDNTVFEREQALKAKTAEAALLEIKSDNLQAVRDAQDTGLKQQDEQIANLRKQVEDLTAALDTERRGRAAAEAVIEDIRKRQAAARKAGKTKAAKKAA